MYQVTVFGGKRRNEIKEVAFFANEFELAIYFLRKAMGFPHLWRLIEHLDAFAKITWEDVYRYEIEDMGEVETIYSQGITPIGESSIPTRWHPVEMALGEASSIPGIRYIR